jgi:hypothetical protein
VLDSEPSGGLLDERKEDRHDTDWHELESDRDTPLDRTPAGRVEGDGVVDPERHGDTDDDHDLEQTGDPASDLLGRDLTGVCGAHTRHESDAEARDKSTAVDLPERVGSHGLDDAADDEDDAADHERPLAADVVHERRAEDGTKEGCEGKFESTKLTRCSARVSTHLRPGEWTRRGPGGRRLGWPYQ